MYVNIDYEAFQAELVRLRRHFHMYPELSLEEKATADYAEKYLKSLGLKTARIGEHGIVAVIWADGRERHDLKTIAIRCEMDALAIKEENDIPWKSQNDGVMHACGHDAILASGLVLAKLCVRYQSLLSANIKFIFQPAEENGKGTKLMLDGGVMKNPDVDYFVMYHYVNDAPSGVELHRGASSAAIGSVSVTIHGKTSHWSSYSQGIDTISAAADVLKAIRNLNETYESSSPFLLGIGRIAGGTAKNIIAGKTVLEGTIRACSIKDYQNIRSLFLCELEKIQRQTRVTMDIEIDESPIPPILNDDRMVDTGLEAGKNVWGNDCRLVTTQYLSGDSASYYFDYAKGIFFVFTAGKDNETAYPLHSGKFDLDEAVLWKSVAVLHQFLLQLAR